MTQFQEMCDKAPYSKVLEASKSEKTKVAYANAFVMLDRFLTGGDPWKMTAGQMFEFITKFKKEGQKDSSISLYMAAYKRLYKYGMTKGLISEDPTKVFENISIERTKREPKVLSKEQRQHLKASLKWDKEFHIRVSLSVMIGLYAGLHTTEIRLLKWEDINFDTKEFHLTGERNKEAFPPVDARLMELFLRYRKDSGYVIGEITPDPFNDWHKKNVKQWCGWGDEVAYTCEVLRNCFIKELIENNVDYKTLLTFFNTIKDRARLASFDSITPFLDIK